MHPLDFFRGVSSSMLIPSIFIVTLLPVFSCFRYIPLLLSLLTFFWKSPSNPESRLFPMSRNIESDRFFLSTSTYFKFPKTVVFYLQSVRGVNHGFMFAHRDNVDKQYVECAANSCLSWWVFQQPVPWLGISYQHYSESNSSSSSWPFLWVGRTNVLFTFRFLGIVAIVVSATRVGKSKQLKAIIGR